MRNWNRSPWLSNRHRILRLTSLKVRHPRKVGALVTTHQELHPVEMLFAHLDDVGPYPDHVLPTPVVRITGRAFFPGGSGLWWTQRNQPLPPMPVGGVMVLGHNWGPLKGPEGFEERLELGEERRTSPTWGPLIKLLTACDLKPEWCFFTNAYMGLLDDNGEAVTPFPGAQDTGFERRCQDFLLLQLRIQQPHLLLTLGKQVPPFLAPLTPELKAAWTGKPRFPDLDAAECALMYPVQFPDVPHPTAVVALTHAALRGSNVHRRWYGDKRGDAAELALIGAALSCLGRLLLHRALE